MDDAIEKSAMRKIYLRLLPFAVLSYFLAYIDRINVSFAGADDARRSEHVGHRLRVRARHLLLGLFHLRGAEQPDHGKGRRAAVDRPHHDHLGHPGRHHRPVTGSTSFAVVRFLLGVAEAGFFPGIMLYFTYWFPSYHHARIVSGFLIGLPIAVALGAPISTALLGLDGWLGLRGWQIMYIAEAIPTVLIGVVTLFLLTDRPEQARFLYGGGEDLARRKACTPSGGPRTPCGPSACGRQCTIPRSCCCRLNYLGIVTASLGMLFFIPQIIKSLGNSSNMNVGWLTMIPYICGGIGMVRWGHRLRPHERAAVEFVGGVRGLHRRARHRRHDDGNLVGARRHVDRGDGVLRLEGPVLGDAADVPDRHWRPPAPIAWINSIGNLGGFFGSWYVGFMKDLTGSYAGGLYGLALVRSDRRVHLGVLPAHPKPCRFRAGFGCA